MLSGNSDCEPSIHICTRDISTAPINCVRHQSSRTAYIPYAEELLRLRQHAIRRRAAVAAVSVLRARLLRVDFGAVHRSARVTPWTLLERMVRSGLYPRRCDEFRYMHRG